ncbi:MAG: MATE family efflux transporter [Treponemataceae bacterium]|nr:MATE family efflux transporter [Treponemataceae bacterium]
MKQKRLTDNNLFLKNLFTIALPIILQNFLSSLVNMLDTIMVGQLGHIEIAAVGLANQIFFVMTIVIFGIASGGAIFITQYWGKKDTDGMLRSTGVMISASIVVSIFFFFSATFAPEFCLSIYSDDQEVIVKASPYLKAVAPCYIFTAVSLAFGQALRSTEKVKLPMIATSVSVVVNTILNFILIFGIKINGTQIIKAYGIVGAAIATVISRIIECIILLSFAYAKKFEIAANPKRWFKYQPGFLPRYLRICFPVLINETLWGFGNSLQNSIYGHAGTDIFSAFSITCTISNLVWTFFIGCGNAAAILIGKKIGEQQHEQAQMLAKKLTFFMAISACFLALLLIPLAFSLPFFFKVNPEVIHMARVFLYMTAVLYPLFAMNMCLVVGVCRSGGDSIYGTFMDIGFMWILALPLGFCAVKFWGLPYWGIFLCIHTEDIFKMTMGLIRLKSGKWLHDVTVD